MNPNNQYNRDERKPDPLQEGEYLVSSAAGQKKRFTLDQDVLFGVPMGSTHPVTRRGIDGISYIKRRPLSIRPSARL